MVFKCKMCGGALGKSNNNKVAVCEYCESVQTISGADDEKRITLFNRANKLRIDCEFDKASGIYESIITEFPNEAEAFWGLCLCKYGIEYIDDPLTAKKIPTCHRTRPMSIMDDDDFAQVCEKADIHAKDIYLSQAKEIEKIQNEILKVVANEKPYDIFICYKETDISTGIRTEDSGISQDIYTELIKEGYRVFFSRVTLRCSQGGTEYESCIYAALLSAKLMLAIGTKYDYYDAVWVKNEWSRFIGMMSDDKTKVLIPCFRNMDANDMPAQFKSMQALDMASVTFFKDLMSNVKRIIPKNEKPTTSEATAISSQQADKLLKRAFLYLEDGDYENADEYCEKVLDIDSECALAYLGKLMTELKVRERSKLSDCPEQFDDRNNYKKAIRFGDENLKSELDGYINAIIVRKQEEEARAEQHRKKSAKMRKRSAVCASLVSAGDGHTVGLKADGTVVEVGLNNDDQCKVSGWRNIVAISAGCGDFHTVGLKADGTVVAVGLFINNGQRKVSGWRNIVAISAGCDDLNTVGLKSDGTVVACGANHHGQCNVSDWRDIVSISVGSMYTVGLKADGTVVACGANHHGQCNVSDWRDIVAISAGYGHTVGLKADGTVVACGANHHGQCEVSDWRDIVAISAADYHTVGLKADGTVVATKYTGDQEYNHGQCEVSDWRDIVAISAGDSHTVGLKADGTVVATKYTGDREYYCGQCEVSDWKLFNSVDTLEDELKAAKAKHEEEKRIAEQKKEAEEKRITAEQAERRTAGVCRYCGGEFKGMFSKKCSVCGKAKDY